MARRFLSTIGPYLARISALMPRWRLVRRATLWASYAVFGLTLLYTVLRSNGFFLSIDLLNWGFGVLTLLSLLCPLYWFTYCRGRLHGAIMAGLYCVWLILPFSTSNRMMMWWTLSAVWLERVEKVWEVPMDERRTLRIYNRDKKRGYDDPDLYPAVVESYPLWLEKREYLTKRDMYWNDQTDSTEIRVDGRTYVVPKPPELNRIVIDRRNLSLHPNERMNLLRERGPSGPMELE